MGDDGAVAGEAGTNRTRRTRRIASTQFGANTGRNLPFATRCWYCAKLEAGALERSALEEVTW